MGKTSTKLQDAIAVRVSLTGGFARARVRKDSGTHASAFRI
ncbi:hypothetical protein [Scytonema sp. HK-05]|nr:hypothetical protein [Scytonema sp. HK-05]